MMLNIKCLKPFYISCLSPESLNDNNCTWQVFWLALLLNTFPSLIMIRQWYVDCAELMSETNQHSRAYSYGDSAGFTPDFPFNPERSGTIYSAKVADGVLKSQNKLYTLGQSVIWSL